MQPFTAAANFTAEVARNVLAVGVMGAITGHAVFQDIYRRVLLKNNIYEGMKQICSDVIGKEQCERMTVHQVAALEGYTVEDHVVETKDGFLLTLHRLKPHKMTSVHHSRCPVLLQHGLYQSSMLYVMSKKDQGLAYILSDAGYDVWIGNNRGNLHSRRHTCLKPEDKEFWEWGLDELAQDVEANITYITRSTGRSKLAYIGHSQGCAQALAAFSCDEALRNKVSSCILLSPGAFVRQMPCAPLRVLANLANQHPDTFFLLFGKKSFLPFMDYLRYFLPQRIFSYCGYTMFNYLFQWHNGHWDNSRSDFYFSETPAGTSSRTIAQWMQYSFSGRFHRYCYKEEHLNIHNYGHQQAPEYPLEKMDLPTAVIYGGKDDLLDFGRLINNLPNCILQKKIEHHAHLDSIIAIDANSLVFPHILQVLETYSDLNKENIEQQKKRSLITHTSTISVVA